MKNILFILLLSYFAVYSQPKYEFRAVWVATVDNIDWPSTKFLSTDSQKIEFIKLLDLHKQNGMNAIVAQIRPAADAFYPSSFEPWSEWLTGAQGKAPSPYYDPLDFMIKETHKRNMEFHAWLNPYRAVYDVYHSTITPTHITKVHPEWFLQYGEKKYFDPGNKDVQIFVTTVVRDIVRRYDVDAIHFDDYFYPYRIPKREFPDSVSYAKYGNGMTKDDWRRSNVDSIILKLSNAIKEERRYCKFGISPFGVWRNKSKDSTGSETQAGQTNYDDLYADILLWTKMKWIDYVAPQLYWEIGFVKAPYEVLIDWWAKNSYGRQLFIGQGFYRTLENRKGPWKDPKQIPDQIAMLRKYKEVQGSIFFSSKSFYTDPNGWNDSLKNNYYKYPAIVPPMPWIDSAKPHRPQIVYDSMALAFKDSISIAIFNGKNSIPVKAYIIYAFTSPDKIDTGKAQNIIAIINSQEKRYSFLLKDIPSAQNSILITVCSLSRTNNESPLSRYIYLERKPQGWKVVARKENK
jgi:uncharacterized lipoprotein YddW (UPF0748 family)